MSASLALPAVAGAATGASATAKPAAATTTLRTSATTSRYDFWVTFRAHVSAAAGSVAFTDASNGTVLGTAPVRDGTAELSTAALAPGSRTVVARYLGTARSGGSSSAATRVRVAASADSEARHADPRDDRAGRVAGEPRCGPARVS